MPTGVFSERRVRNSDGLNPKLSALRTVQRLLKKQRPPTSSLQDGWGASLLPNGEGEREGQSEHAQLRNPSPLPSPLLKGERRYKPRSRIAEPKPNEGAILVLIVSSINSRR